MAKSNVLPPGPSEAYAPSQDLLSWLTEQFERYGDIFRASIYGSSVFAVNAPDMIEHVLLKNWQNYIRKGQAVKRIALSLGNGLISSNGTFWVRQRRMLQPAFNRDALNALAPMIKQVNLRLHDRWIAAARHQATINVTRDVSMLTLEITLRAIFGDDYEQISPHFALVAEERRDLDFAKECSSLTRLIIDLVSQRRAAALRAGDILGRAMEARDRDTGRPMSEPQIAREMLTLVIAGHETTASVLNWTWYLLSAYPLAEEKMAAELDALLGQGFSAVEDFPRFSYLRQVLEEALRLYPPLWLMTRRAVAEDRLGDYVVPAGTEIYISPYFVQRHPRFWQLPEQFDPVRSGPDASSGRQSMAACPFGAGPRNCIGEYMARLEMQIHLMTMACGLRLQYDPGHPVELIAGTNLLSRDNFIMIPKLKANTPEHSRSLLVG